MRRSAVRVCSSALKKLLIFKGFFFLYSAKIALEIGNSKCMNIVLFGAMVKALNLDNIDWEAALKETLPTKILDINLKAFKAGYEA